MAKLELKQVNKTYSARSIPVKNVSLSLEDGQFLTLLGPSGCGKSTLLRLIAGLEAPTHGQIFLGGADVTHYPPGDRNLAMVFQSYALYPHLSVADNLASGLKLKKIPAPEIQQRVGEVAQLLGLEGLLSRKPGQLSGGQRQRVAVGRALVRRAQLYLLDEPLSNLDALLRERVRAELKQLFAAQDAPVVYVTHDQTEAMTLSTQVAVLYDGYIQQLDPPEGLYSQPANLFVAGFVGSPQMNLLTLPCQGRHALLGPLTLPLPALPAVPPQIVLGIRPEHLRLARPEDVLVLKGRVFLVENLGMHHLVSVRVEAATPGAIAIRVLLATDQPWSGDEITLALCEQHLHWFDVQTGKRV